MRKSKTVVDFKKVRSETLEAVKTTLARREVKGEIGDDEGYTGDWVDVRAATELESVEKGGKIGAKDDTDAGEEVPSRHSGAALAAAAEAGRQAADEARINEEYEFVDL